MRHLATTFGSLAVALTVVAAGRAQSPAPLPPAANPAAIDALSKMADEVTAEVQQIRGWSFKRPVPRSRVDLATAVKSFQRQVAASLPPERLAVLQALLRTAGLVPPDCDLMSSAVKALDQQVAGYYDPAAGTLTLVERPGTMPEVVQRMVLAHELEHALDDQQVGIASLVDPNADRSQDLEVVLSALSEGSATSLMMHYLVRQAAAGKVNALEFASYYAQELERAKSLGNLPRYFNAMFGSYMIGAAFLSKGDIQAVLTQPDDRATGENFATAWKTPPRSSEQILHPGKYWDPVQADEPVIVDDRSAERWLAGTGHHVVVHRDTLGELLTALLTEPRNAPQDLGKFMSATAWTNPGAIGWGGDRFYLLAAGRTVAEARRTLDDVTGVWVTAWDGRHERERFIDALAQGHPPAGSAVERVGDRVAVVFIGVGPAERASLMKRLPSTPLRMTKAGRPWTAS